MKVKSGGSAVVVRVALCLVLSHTCLMAWSQPASALTTAQVEDSNRDFAGFNFGVGFSVTVDTGTSERIEAAQIDQLGIVRVDKRGNVKARVVLESHYFFRLGELPSDGLLTKGWGPFLAVLPGDDEVIKAIGAGVIFGFRRGGELAGHSFNIGIGFMVDPTDKILGSEFRENEPAPQGPGGDPLPLRFEERDQGGVLALVSFAW